MESLSDLVCLAKGIDRSMREYAKDSGVDVSIISKIINGKYIPKKKDVLQKLTSKEADPHCNVTYEKLVAAVQNELNLKNEKRLKAMSTSIKKVIDLNTMSKADYFKKYYVITRMSEDKEESKKVRLYLTFTGDFNHLDADWEPDPDKAARFVSPEFAVECFKNYVSKIVMLTEDGTKEKKEIITIREFCEYIKYDKDLEIDFHIYLDGNVSYLYEKIPEEDT